MSSQSEVDIEFAKRKIQEIGKYVGKYFVDAEQNLSQNSVSLFDYKFPEIHIERQKEYKKIIIRKIESLFSPEEVNSFNLGNMNGLFLSIVDHHGILNHPFLFGANVASHFHKLFSKNKKTSSIITLDCSNCPLNDPFHKRGFQFHGRQINIFSKNDKNKLVYSVPLVGFRIMDKIITTKKNILFSKEELDFLRSISDKIDSIDFSKCKRYSDQITKINYHLWPMLFEKFLRKDLIDLIQLEHDEILIEFLFDFFKKEETFIYKALFDEEFRSIILDKFRGNYSAWDEKRNYGTHFFWHIDKDGVQHRLYLNEEEKLVAANNFSIALEKNAILEGLRQKTIIPGMFLKFSIFVCYLGVIPFGGFGGVNYLSTIKNIWLDVLPEEYKFEKELISKIKTDGLITIPMVYDYDQKNEKILEQYAFDVMYKGGITKEYLEKIDKLRMDELMRPAIEMTYNYYSNLLPPEDRKEIKFDEKSIYAPLIKLFKNV